MKGSIRLGNIAGIGVFIHWTFSLLIAFIIISNYRAGQNVEQIGWAILFVLSIFGTIFLHELGHALAAKRYNFKTIDITLLPIGGVARLETIPEKPKEELVVAFAGPAVNLLIAFILFFFISIPTSEQLLKELTTGVLANNFLLHFFIVNIWLALFNLIPAFPMDGGRVLRALLAMKMNRAKATHIAAKIGQTIAVAFILLGLYSNPFLVFVGLFIFLGAQSEAVSTETKSLLEGATVKDITMRQFQTIQANEPLRTAVHQLLNTQGKDFIVLENNEPVGTLTRDHIIKALSNDGESVPIHLIMNKEVNFLQEDIPLDQAYQQMLQNKNAFMPVLKNNQFVGVLDMENILEYVLIKKAGAGHEHQKTSLQPTVV